MKLYGHLFQSNLKLLSEETGLDTDSILKSRAEGAVDCRMILIMVAKEYRVTDAKINAFSGLSKQQIQRAKASFEERKKNLDVSILWKKVLKNTEKEIEDYRK